jgi:hypothetical protein
MGAEVRFEAELKRLPTESVILNIGRLVFAILHPWFIPLGFAQFRIVKDDAIFFLKTETTLFSSPSMDPDPLRVLVSSTTGLDTFPNQPRVFWSPPELPLSSLIGAH